MQPSPKFERLPDVMARTGLSRASIYRLAGRGQFPRPHKLGVRTSVWLADDIDAWILGQIGSMPTPMPAVSRLLSGANNGKRRGS